MKKSYVVFSSALMLLAGCVREKEIHTYTARTSDYFNTVVFLRCSSDMSEQQFSSLWSDITDVLREIDQTCSLSYEDSELSRFNRLSYGESMEVSDLTAHLLQNAYKVYEETDGAFDPTVYPLTDLWGFTPRFSSNHWKASEAYDRFYESDGVMALPEEQWIHTLLPLTDFEGIVLSENNNTYVLTKNIPDVTYEDHVYHASIDLGGIAKGYACDQVYEILSSADVENAAFSCGDSSIYILHNDDENTPLNLKKPRKGSGSDDNFTSVDCHTTGISTSNDASQALIKDGTIYTHIINPETGYPAGSPEDTIPSNCISVSVFMDSACEADAVTTALSAMEQKDALAYLADHPAVQYVLVYRGEQDGYDVYTNIDDLELKEPSYHLK